MLPLMKTLKRGPNPCRKRDFCLIFVKSTSEFLWLFQKNVRRIAKFDIRELVSSPVRGGIS